MKFDARRSMCALAILAFAPEARAQSFCKVVGEGSPDPNKVLYWTLATRRDTTCTYSINPPNYWINIATRIAVRPQHGTAGFADPVNLAFKPAPGYMGPDRFVIEIHRKVVGTGEQVRRVIDFAVTISP
jgi:hypothetical protein